MSWPETFNKRAHAVVGKEGFLVEAFHIKGHRYTMYTESKLSVKREVNSLIKAGYFDITVYEGKVKFDTRKKYQSVDWLKQ